MTSENQSTAGDLSELVKSVDWYHTIDLGNGMVTPGEYDHRPYLEFYGFPDSLAGKTVLDVGAASGFFSFELERRGAKVTATDLGAWFDHDFSPIYQSEHTAESGGKYIMQPFDIAKEALGSKVQRKFMNVYDFTEEDPGVHDLVFCGSMLIHLTDPLRAIWNLSKVTREKAILASVVHRQEHDRPIAIMIGPHTNDAWWIPTRKCLELMAVTAGFTGIEWVSEFQLDYSDGRPGPYHGVLHAHKTTENWGPQVEHRDEIIAREKRMAAEYARNAEEASSGENGIKGWLNRHFR